MLNPRFVGAWELLSYELRATDGTVTFPLGEAPLGMALWSEGGQFSTVLASGDPAVERHFAYCGTSEADDGEAGTLTTHSLAASSDGLRGVQARTFRFTSPGELELRPPPDARGRVSTLRWRRCT